MANRYKQNFRNNTRLTNSLKDRKTLYYYGLRIIPIILVIGAIIALLYFYGGSTSEPEIEENIATEDIFDLSFPVVSGEGLTGEDIRLGDFDGKPLLSWNLC